MRVGCGFRCRSYSLKFRLLVARFSIRPDCRISWLADFFWLQSKNRVDWAGCLRCVPVVGPSLSVYVGCELLPIASFAFPSRTGVESLRAKCFNASKGWFFFVDSRVYTRYWFLYWAVSTSQSWMESTHSLHWNILPDSDSHRWCKLNCQATSTARDSRTFRQFPGSYTWIDFRAGA